MIAVANPRASQNRMTPALAGNDGLAYNRQRLKMRQRIPEQVAPGLNWVASLCCVEFRPMSDQELAVQAVRDAQLILEEYLETRPHDHEGLLDRLVEVLERPSVMVPVDRLQRGVGQ